MALRAEPFLPVGLGCLNFMNNMCKVNLWCGKGRWQAATPEPAYVMAMEAGVLTEKDVVDSTPRETRARVAAV